MEHTTRCQHCDGTGIITTQEPKPVGRASNGETVTNPRWLVARNRFCQTCHGSGTVAAPDPTPDGPGTITVGGHTLTAPGFTADQFERAIARAHAEGLRADATDRADTLIISNPLHASCYSVTRHYCTCPAGRHGRGCKHRALGIFLADVAHDLPTATPATTVAA